MACRGPVCLAALVLALITAPPVLAQPTLDDGRPGPGARWDPGMLLVKLRPDIAPSHRRRMLRRLGLRQVDRLPLVPDLFEVRVPPGKRVRTAERKLRRRSEVLYAQPDRYRVQDPQAGPSDRSYWPNDPLFWPFKSLIQPHDCKDRPKRLEQWPLWQLGQNLTDSGDHAHALFNPQNPHPAGANRADVNGGLTDYEQYHSINVLPVWNQLRAQNRLTGRDKRTAWQTKDIQRSGIAVQDTGLSNAPDIAPQIAALFSTVSVKKEKPGDKPRDKTHRDLVFEVYRDDPARDDLKTVQDALKDKGIEDDDFAFTNRPLFALDDTDPGQPTDTDPGLPTGCDGHGTQVASVAAAKANNKIGIAGVAYDVPLIGLRPGEVWDRPDKKDDAVDARIKDARKTSMEWRNSGNAQTLENAVHELHIVTGLQIPVLNMSYGRDLFAKPAQKGAPPVVKDPVWAHALLRTLATGKTLGVAAAGNDGQQYGSGRTPQPGTEKQAPGAPCGLKLIELQGALVEAGGKTFSADAFPGPSANPNDPSYNPNNPTWEDVNLLCVAASSKSSSQLADFSGRGDAAVDLAAPGEDIPAAARPLVDDRGVAHPSYSAENGTSLAAPMVAGAAALLREAAPRAPIGEIAHALRSGARMNPFLKGQVRYGSLDVACALRALKRRAEGLYWDLVTLDDPAFANATRDCGGKPRYVEQTIHPVDANNLRRQPTTPLKDLIAAKKLSDQPNSVSLKWQTRLLDKQSAQRVAFDSTGTAVAPAEVADDVYDAGRASVGCTEPAFMISGRLSVGVEGDDGAPQLWYFPTDTQPRRDPTDGEPRRYRIEVALALAKPIPKKAKSLKIRLRAHCNQFPSLPR